MLYAFIIICFCILVLNRIVVKHVFDKLSYKREFSLDKAEIDQTIEVKTNIENSSIIPISFVSVSEKYPASMEYIKKAEMNKKNKNIYHSFHTYILPFQKVQRIYEICFKERGKYFFNEVSISCGDLIGIKNVNKSVDVFQTMLIYPKYLNLDENYVLYGEYNGKTSVKRWIIEDVSMVVGLKEYTGMEPIKYIHWPSLAKYGQMMVKEFDYTIDQSTAVILNTESCKPFWGDIKAKEIEECISICRSIIEELFKNSILFNFYTNAQGTTVDKDSYYMNVLEKLAVIDYGIKEGFEKLIESIYKADNRFSTCIIITPTILEEYIDYINKLSNNNIRVILFSVDTQNIERINKNIKIFIKG